MSKRYAYVLLTNEKWWNRRCSQNKAGKKLHAFVRKGTVGPTKTELVFFYVTHPLKEIRGIGEFVERVKGDVDELWNKHGHETVFESRKEYMDFMQGRTKVTFIRFKNLRLFSPPISLKDISQIMGIDRMSRNGRYINKEIARELIQRTIVGESGWQVFDPREFVNRQVEGIREQPSSRFQGRR